MSFFIVTCTAVCSHKKPKRVCVREPLASKDGGGGEIHLGEFQFNLFLLHAHFQQKVFGYKWRGSTILYFCHNFPQILKGGTTEKK